MNEALNMYSTNIYEHDQPWWINTYHINYNLFLPDFVLYQ